MPAGGSCSWLTIRTLRVLSLARSASCKFWVVTCQLSFPAVVPKPPDRWDCRAQSPQLAYIQQPLAHGAQVPKLCERVDPHGQDLQAEAPRRFGALLLWKDGAPYTVP